MSTPNANREVRMIKELSSDKCDGIICDRESPPPPYSGREPALLYSPADYPLFIMGWIYSAVICCLINIVPVN